MSEPITTLIYDFKCRCQGEHCETLEEEIPGDPRVIIETCGCFFRMSHLGSVIAPKLPEKIVEWFQSGQSVYEGYTCPMKDGKISSTFGINDVVLDQGRYMDLWKKANQAPNKDFKALTEEKFENAYAALPPEALGTLLLEAVRNKDSKEKSLEYMKQKNALRGRILACNHEEWGPFQKLSFMIRAVYHIGVAFFVGYGTIFLRGGNFISEGEQREMLLSDMGERLRLLFLEYYGFRYNPEDYPSRTIEARLWNSILGK